MARLRKFCAYRRLERPYTRKSKYRSLCYVRGTPSSKVVRYMMGNFQKDFEYTVSLVSDVSLQIRHNAIESARQSCNKQLEAEVGKANYKYTIRMYPHHILRENPLATGAGADRLSTGMQKAFGKPIGVAAQVKRGKTLMTIDTDKQFLTIARDAIKRASYKLPGTCSILVTSKAPAVK